MKLTAAQARALLLAAQGLDQPPPKKTTQADVLAAIRRMKALQIDTIHVVARSPYLVLYSRLGHYDPKWLDNLLAETAIFEYWAHEACFLPIEDYPLYRRMMLNREMHWWGRIDDWIAAHTAAVNRVLQRIHENGAVRSADFQRTDGKKGSWWEWKEEKIALDYLYSRGDLMITRRHNFQRLYDLRERVLPHWDDAQAPPLETVYQTLIEKSLKALGITQLNWVADYFRLPKKQTAALVKQWIDDGRLIEVEVEGWKSAGYLMPDMLPVVEDITSGKRKPKRTVLLSPFDPVVWDRARALAMFNFDYRIECYTPAPKRRYGYFSLPILWKDQLIGRLDPKAHRKDGVFEIKNLHLEPQVKINAALLDDLAAALRECAVWHKTPEIVIRQSDPSEFAAALEQALR